MKATDKLIQIARQELGYTESPANSNNTKFGAAYGLQGQPWCMIFLWWCFREAGLSPLFYGGQKTASCGALLRWAQREGLTVPVDDAQPGDIVVLNFHGTLDTEHCGLVVEVPTVGRFVTVEGNTAASSTGSQDNGGIVAQKTRYAHQTVGVIRPRYETMDYVGHWAEATFRWGIDRGLVKGYEDGSFQPDRAVTRAELLTILRRLEGE